MEDIKRINRQAVPNDKILYSKSTLHIIRKANYILLYCSKIHTMNIFHLARDYANAKPCELCIVRLLVMFLAFI